jgi:hypothetical protein
MSHEQPITRWSERFARPPALLTQWVALLAAMLSLGISSFTLVTTNREPDVRGLMPDQVRLVQGGSQAPYLYVQPAFVRTGASQRAEIITDMTVRVEPLEGGRPSGAWADFTWTEQGEWLYDPTVRETTWSYTSDDSPFVVSPEQAQVFTGVFTGPPEWRFVPGAYRLTLTAERMVGSEPVQLSGEVVVTQEQIDTLNAGAGMRFLGIPVTAE